MGYADPEVQAAYQNEWINNRREAWFKENGPCVSCGSWDRLEVDHIDPATKVSHRIWSWSAARRLPELAKCQALCRPCHESKTAEENRERNGGLNHGTETMYCKYGCRCAPCRQVRNAIRAERRARRKALGLPAK